jgi:hypothetical protein
MKYRKYPNWVIMTNKEIPFPYMVAEAEHDSKVAGHFGQDKTLELMT